MIHFPCSSCHYEVSAPGDKVGTFILCPSCFTRQRIPPPVTNEEIEVAEAMDKIYGLHTDETIKEYKETIPVYCQLCHTLMHAAAEHIGSFLTCPDCGTKTQVRPDLGERKKEEGFRSGGRKSHRLSLPLEKGCGEGGGSL